MSYWDTSCPIKLYAPEPDSRIFRDFLEADTACVTCDLTPLEFWAAVRRKESEGVLAPGEARILQSALENDLADGLIRMTSCDPAVRSRFDEIRGPLPLTGPTRFHPHQRCPPPRRRSLCVRNGNRSDGLCDSEACIGIDFCYSGPQSS